MKKIKQLKKVNRERQLADIRKHGASERVPKGNIFKDRKKDERKYGARGPIKSDD